MNIEGLAYGLSECLDMDYRYEVDYEASYERDCDANGCDREGICRCDVIVDTEVRDHRYAHENSRLILKRLDSSIPLDKVDYSTLERVLSILLKDSLWHVKVVGGYYGDEVDGVFLQCDKDKIIEAVEKVSNLKDLREVVMFLIELEYGYILESLKEYENVYFASVPVKDIVFPNSDYSGRVKGLMSFDYSDHEGSFGVVRESGDKFAIVDGYHRIVWAKSNNVKKVNVFVFGAKS